MMPVLQGIIRDCEPRGLQEAGKLAGLSEQGRVEEAMPIAA